MDSGVEGREEDGDVAQVWWEPSLLVVSNLPIISSESRVGPFLSLDCLSRFSIVDDCFCS